MGLRAWIGTRFIQWLTKERDVSGSPLCDFQRLRFEIRPCDVVLIEGRSRVSDVIKTITQSPWTHSALYIGRLAEIDDPDVRGHIEQFHQGDPHEQLVIEALLGEGTIVTPLHKYAREHLRICRPKGLSRPDVSEVIAYTTRHLGCDYDLRQLLDLARFMFPYGVLPRRWRSTLFAHNAGQPTRTVCSSMIAAAFSSVQYPIIPVVHRSDDGALRLYKRNVRLFTPKDFDYSPYFDIIKHPYLGFEDMAIYRTFPWEQPVGEDDSGRLPAEILMQVQAQVSPPDDADPMPSESEDARHGVGLLKEVLSRKTHAKRA
ncbi:MAG: YiiX/YebB-like N1pC/P60 family cysteine hydrolase [Gammaproteobacteria bacterium]